MNTILLVGVLSCITLASSLPAPDPIAEENKGVEVLDDVDDPRNSNKETLDDLVTAESRRRGSYYRRGSSESQSHESNESNERYGGYGHGGYNQGNYGYQGGYNGYPNSGGYFQYGKR